MMLEVPQSSAAPVRSPSTSAGHEQLATSEAPAIAVDDGSDAQPVAGAFHRQRALDGLRGIAVLGVMFFHFSGFEHPRSFVTRLLVDVASACWAGVDLFFTLSGFLITGILLDTKGSSHFFRNFYARRALRIFPLYYAVVAISVTVVWVSARVGGSAPSELWNHQSWLWAYATNIEDAIAGRWVFNTGMLWLDHLWSLAVEEQFYLVWPLVVFALGRRRLAITAIGAIALAPLARALLLARGTPALTVYSMTLCRLDALAVGALVAVVARDPTLRRRALRTLPWLPVLAAGVVVAVIVWRHGLFWLDGTTARFALTPLAVIAGSTLLFVTNYPRHPVTRALERPSLIFFGKYSYGLYVLHYILWPFLDRVCPAPRLAAALGSEALGLVAHLSIGIAASVALAVFSFQLFERRFLGLKGLFGPEPGSRARLPAARPALGPSPG
jgi:peptidoglycan/LPS O-acetylase OafA/YrhL